MEGPSIRIPPIFHATDQKNQLGIGDLDDKVFSVSGRILKKYSFIDLIFSLFYKLFGYVKVYDGDQTVIIKINSLYEKLKLQKEEIGKVHTNEELKDLIYNRAQVFHPYHQFSNEVGQNPLLDPQLKSSAKKIAEIATERLVKNPFDPTFVIKEPNPQIGKRKYIVQFKSDAKGRQKIEMLQLTYKLGVGSFAKVFRATPVHYSHLGFMALKISRKGIVGKRAAEDVRNEFQLLNEIHQNGAACGIQSKPHTAIDLTNPSRVGILGDLYDANYEAITSGSSLDSFSIEAFQLLSGLTFLEILGIAHGDLKPANILIKTQGPFPILHIADLGGARKVEKALPDVGTPLYRANSDQDIQNNLKKLKEEGISAALNAEIDRRLVELALKRDVFAMGIILYERFTGKPPYPNFGSATEGCAINTGKKLEPIKGIAAEFNELILSMLDPNPFKRPSGIEAFKRFQTLLQATDRKTFETIQKELMPLYPGSNQIDQASSLYPSVLYTRVDALAEVSKWPSFSIFANQDQVLKSKDYTYKVWPSQEDPNGLEVLISQNSLRVLSYNSERDGNFGQWFNKQKI